MSNRQRDLAASILREEDLDYLSKARTQLYFGRTRVLKFLTLDNQYQQLRIRQNLARIKLIPEFSSSRLHVMSPSEVAIDMPRMPTHLHLARQLFECDCGNVLKHVEDLSSFNVSVSREPAIRRMRSDVANSLILNFKNQIYDRDVIDLNSQITNVLPSVVTLVDNWYDSAVSVRECDCDGHGNLFSSNIWTLRSGNVALDPSISVNERLIPAVADSAGTLVDILCLHPASANDRLEALELSLEIKKGSRFIEDSRAQDVYLVATIIKLLVRFRYSVIEHQLDDSAMMVRDMDRMIVESSAPLIETLAQATLTRSRDLHRVDLSYDP